MSDILRVRGNEFIRRVQSLAKKRGVACRVDEKRGKGSHVTLYFGDRLTVVRNPKDELKTGTLHAMCKQLGIEKGDL
jgi:mRNA interferase HicA